MTKGTPDECKFLIRKNSCLGRLIKKSAMIFAWLKHCEFAKGKKHLASELCDKEKLSDAFLVVGESYQKLRDFSKALKWYKRVGKDTSQLEIWRIAAEAKLRSV